LLDFRKFRIKLEKLNVMDNETNKNNQNTLFVNCCNSNVVASEIIINETDIVIKIERKNQSTQTQQDDKYLNKKTSLHQKRV
jgi:hypothetical protein